MAKHYVVDNGGVVHRARWLTWQRVAPDWLDVTICGIDIDAAKFRGTEDASATTVTCIACIVALAH